MKKIPKNNEPLKTHRKKKSFSLFLGRIFIPKLTTLIIEILCGTVFVVRHKKPKVFLPVSANDSNGVMLRSLNTCNTLPIHKTHLRYFFYLLIFFLFKELIANTLQVTSHNCCHVKQRMQIYHFYRLIYIYYI